MIEASIRVVILDFDGVVIESNQVKTLAFADVFARFPEHAEAMMAFHHANVSASRFVKIDHLVTNLLGRPGDTALRDSLANEFSRRSRELIATVPYVDGAEALLETVSSRVPLYLASVTPAEDLGAILAERNLTHFFHGVYGCPPWNKPAAIRDVLAHQGVRPDEAVLVGDSGGDQRAAAQTGVHFIARQSGLPFEWVPTVSFSDLTGVVDFLHPKLR
jgi:phosphoglycolate phosphatase